MLNNNIHYFNIIRGEYSNTDTLTINHNNFIIYHLNVSKFDVYVYITYIHIIAILKFNLIYLTLR